MTSPSHQQSEMVSPCKSLEKIDEHSIEKLVAANDSTAVLNLGYVVSTSSESDTTIDFRTVAPTSSIRVPDVVASSPRYVDNSAALDDIVCSVKAVEPQRMSIPLKGAWMMPLLKSPTMAYHEHVAEDFSSLSQWPSLSSSHKISQNRLQSQGKAEIGTSALKDPISAKERLVQTSNLEAQNQRFPWAAKMNPSMRNLYKATSPIYMEDGTPKVQIPSHVLLKGLENQKEFIIGQFYRCSTPSGGLIHAVINKIWGRRCKIFIRKLGDSSYLFHIPDESTRSWVIQRGLWHIDDCLMFVAPWTPASTLTLPEISSIPVWVTLRNIPNQLYSIEGISWIASGLGAPMATNKPRLDPTLMGQAKILVEVELNKPFPQRIAAEDMKGTLFMIDVEYSWVPSKCVRCGQLGHKESRCLQKRPDHASANVSDTKTVDDSTKSIASPTLETQKSSLVPETKTSSTEIAITPVSSDTLLGNATILEEVPMPLTEAISCTTHGEVHETITVVAEAAPIIEVSVTSPKITHASEFSTFSSPQFLDITALSGNMTIPLVVESNAFGTMVSDIGVLSTPESSDTDVDLVIPSSQRILRERPVQPTLKYNDDEWISVSTCRRGKRSRGSRRGRFG